MGPSPSGSSPSGIDNDEKSSPRMSVVHVAESFGWVVKSGSVDAVTSSSVAEATVSL
ncbi:hypothetical protein GCM10027169_36660 [Gordonia jinhuaensis]|uniref:Uncharacterized protein n=1 Tax=Gordonia jinhuaensis TaxID=1517702 RepID=A0A916T3A2_9ACTN|nr:hypothetical protein GCM10011489_13770 [Gordonia jinhuaensis]